MSEPLQLLPTHRSTCLNYFKTFGSTVSLIFSLTWTLRISPSFLHLSSLVILHTLSKSPLPQQLSCVSDHPHTPRFLSIRHRWFFHSFIQLPIHIQAYTPDIKHHLLRTKGFWSLTHPNFYVPLWTFIYTETTSQALKKITTSMISIFTTFTWDVTPSLPTTLNLIFSTFTLNFLLSHNLPN